MALDLHSFLATTAAVEATVHAILGDVHHLSPGDDATLFLPSLLAAAELVRHFATTGQRAWLNRMIVAAVHLRSQYFMGTVILMMTHLQELLARRRDGSMSDTEYKLWCLVIDASVLDGSLGSWHKACCTLDPVGLDKALEDVCAFRGGDLTPAQVRAVLAGA